MHDGEQSSASVRTAPRRAAEDKRLRVQICDAHGRPARAAGLGAWLQRVAPRQARGVVSVALVSDRRIRGLNRAYRRKDYATDVLSFPAFARATSDRASARIPNPESRIPNPDSRIPNPKSRIPVFLGDIVIARGVARRQARAAQHSELTELKVLALHGLLHLLGYDHEHDGGRMLRAERRLRRKGGLRASLI